MNEGTRMQDEDRETTFFTEKLVVNGNKYRLVHAISNVLNHTKLPWEYMETGPCYFGYEIYPEIAVVKRYDELVAGKYYRGQWWYVKAGDLMPESQFQEITRVMREGGKRLIDIRRAEALSKWHGCEEVKI